MNYGKKIALYRPSSRSIESESVLRFDELEEDEKDNVKRKTRNLSEKKRRDQFNVLINELCSMVSANTKKLDKTSVLKSAIQFLRNHQEFSVQSAANEIKEDWKPTFLCNEEFAQLMLEAVDSFLVVFNHQGKVLFTSDSITSLLGHLPSDLINNSLYDLMHEDDRLKVFSILSKHQSLDENFIAFTCHLRRGTIDLMDPVTYECVRIMGTSQIVNIEDDRPLSERGEFGGVDPIPEQALCFCCTVRLQTSHIIREMAHVEEAASEFTSRHSLEWKFLFLDHRAPPIIGYLPFEVLGTSGYDYYHPDDLEVVSQCHEQLMVMGKGTSSFYRFLTKGQQWIWLQTHYYITYHQWNSKPEFIVCTNKVVSYQEVRRQLRQDMGYTEGDFITTAANSTTSTNSPAALADGRSGAVGDSRGVNLHQEGHVTSYSQSDSCLTRMRGLKVQSPDVASTHYSDSERPQLPHSTKQESGAVSDGGGRGGNSSSSGGGGGQKRVSSELQSLLQMHLQRSQAANGSTGGSNAGAISASSAGCGVSSSAPLSHGASATQAPVSSTQTKVKVTSSFESAVMSPTQQQMAPQSRTLPQLVPLMTSMPSSMTPAPTSPRQYPTGLVLTPAQKMLHDQLVHKSEQLQNAIQCQQEELRLIKEQLAYSSGAVAAPQTPTPQQPQQQQQGHVGHMQMHPQQQSRLQQQLQRQHHQHHQQQPQVQPRHQQQYILQQNLSMGPRPMLLTQRSGSVTPQLTMMEGTPSQIFLSPVTSIGVGMPPNQLQQQRQHQATLQHDAGASMLLSPTPSQASSLTMMGGRVGQIFLSPINVDQLHQQPQQHHPLHQHHTQQQQQQQQKSTHHQQQ